MNIASVKPGDIVEVDIRGRRFIAYVDELLKEKGKQSSLKITPAEPNNSYYTCKANQVVGHYKKMQRARGAKRKASNGETLQAL